MKSKTKKRKGKKNEGLKTSFFQKKSFYIILSILILFFVGYTFFPHAISKYYSAKSFKDLNLEVKTLRYKDNVFEYVEGGEGETIVFVHGFQSSKSYWIPYFKKLNKNYSLIAPDLPGHGNSSRPRSQKYNLNALSQSLSNFIEEKKLDNFHLIGTSMGGGIATVYTHNNPDKVKSLILINPLGIDQKEKSDLQLLMEKGKNILFPSDLQEFDEMAEYVTGKPLSLSSYFKKYALSQMVKNYFFYKKAFKELITTSKPLDDILPKIKTPSLILIGKKDRIIHPASYEYFVNLMPNARAVRFKNGSHVFTGKHFNTASSSIEKFLNDRKIAIY